MKGFENETVTVNVPEDGTGRKLEVFMAQRGNSVVNWGLARKFGPLNSMRPAEDSSQVLISCPFQWCPMITDALLFQQLSP